MFHAWGGNDEYILFWQSLQGCPRAVDTKRKSHHKDVQKYVDFLAKFDPKNDDKHQWKNRRINGNIENHAFSYVFRITLARPRTFAFAFPLWLAFMRFYET